MIRDIAIYDPVPTQMLPDDKRSLLVLRDLVARRFEKYAYLEIGSFLGGSLQPYLADPNCEAVYSIDTRPRFLPDERGERFEYPDNTTQRMLDELRPHYGATLDKLTTFETDARDVRDAEVPIKPRLCLIDGEHTDVAALSDFRSCLRLAERPCVITFDDSHIVFRGIGRCLEDLRAQGLEFRAYVLPAKIGVIEVGQLGLFREPELVDLLGSIGAYQHVTDSLEHYRRIVMTVKAIPGVRLIRRVTDAVRGRGGAMGGTRAD